MFFVIYFLSYIRYSAFFKIYGFLILLSFFFSYIRFLDDFLIYDKKGGTYDDINNYFWFWEFSISWKSYER